MFTPHERALFEAAAATPGDDGPRQVLADLLLEREHPLGELLRLEAEERELPRRRALETALRETLRHELIPWARELELDRGLPAWAAYAPKWRFLREGEAPPPWPVRAISVVGEFRDALTLLRSAAVERVQSLDFSSAWADTRFTHWVDGPPAPISALRSLETLALPQGEVAPHWLPIIVPGFSHVRTLSVGLGPSFQLPEWALALPALERIELVPWREPGDGVVADQALRWAARRGAPCLSFLGEALDADGLRRVLRPALPGEFTELPPETTERFELEPEHTRSRLFRGAGTERWFLRAEDVAAQDLFAAPSHRHLTAPVGLVRLRRARFVELRAPGRLLAGRLEARRAARLARVLVETLTHWWSTGAPDVVTGEWVGLGRDQLRLRDDGTLALIPAVTRRLGPEAHALIELAGVPIAWSRTAPSVVRLTCAILFEWLTGLSFLDAAEGSAMAVHRRLGLRLQHPPLVSAVDPELAPFDELLREGLSAPGGLSVSELDRRLALFE